MIKYIFIFLLSGCSSLTTSVMIEQSKDYRDSEVSLRTAAFCAMPANAGLRKFRNEVERKAFLAICDRD